MKKIDSMIRKCKSLSMQLGRSSSYSNLRSKSTKEHQSHHHEAMIEEQEHQETLFVGSTRKRYVINSKYLAHPLLSALIEKIPPSDHDRDRDRDDEHNKMILVKCEVVLFDHLLWMLENADPNLTSGSLEELAELYVF